MKFISTIISASLLIESVAGILGGRKVKPSAMTYTTGLRTTIVSNSPGNINSCGGALISGLNVLTTASCADSISLNYAVVGSIFIDGTEGEQIKIVKITKHPEYNNNTYMYDLAIMTLAKCSKYKPVKLPASDGSDIVPGKTATVVGWGVTSPPPDAELSVELLEVDQKLVTNEACQKAVNWTTIDSSKVCAYGKNKAAPCYGDGGGPLVNKNLKGDDDDIVIGLVSYGWDCGLDRGPSIYTRVSSALAWIHSIIGSSTT